jgi:excisionase family DNA binding protein
MSNTNIFLNGITLQELAEALAPLLQQKPLQQNQVAQVEPSNDLLTRDEVCKLLNFNKTSLWKHTKSGRLKSYGIGNRVLYKKSEVLEAVKPINH